MADPPPIPGLPLVDGDVSLRRWRADDADRYAALLRDPVIVRWTKVPAGYTTAMARARLAFAQDEWRSGRALMLAVVGTSTDQLLGACDLRLSPDDPGWAEVAYLLGGAARGRGVMTRAVRLAAGWAFERLGIERVEAFVDPANVASLAVCERAGFTRERSVRATDPGEHRGGDRVVLSLRRRDLPDPG